MITGNIVIAFFIVQYIMFFINIFDNEEYKKEVVQSNDRIEELRQKRYKTLKEQTEFVKLKYGQTAPKKFKLVPFLEDFFLYTVFFFTIFLFAESVWKPDFFLTLLGTMIIAYFINKWLRKYGLQRQDGMDTLFR